MVEHQQHPIQETNPRKNRSKVPNLNLFETRIDICFAPDYCYFNPGEKRKP